MTRIEMSVPDRKIWAQIDPNIAIPLQQHWMYGQALETFGGQSLQVNFLDDTDTKIATALAIRRRFFGLVTFTTIFRGPIWLTDVSNNQKIMLLKQLRKQFSKLRWNILAILPELDIQNAELGHYKAAGYKKVMTGFSTAWLDLRSDEAAIRAGLKGKWRNQLKKAEAADLHIAVGGRKPHQYSWLLERETDQRSRKGYQATPLGLVPAYVDASKTPSEAMVSITASKNKNKIAGALFLLHGNSATYHIGWAGDEARDLNAQNLVLWQGILTLKARGIRFLDLGGVNTADLAGITRFKFGTGAEPLMLAGTYI